MPKQVFTIDVEGYSKKLFTIQERASGDLTVIIKHGIHLSKSHSYNVSPNSSISQQRYAVHISPNSQSDINDFSMTTITEDGRKISKHHHTSAIKQENLFAGLFCRRSQSLLSEYYNYNGENAVSLGSYDPYICQLIYQVLVGPKDLPFSVYCCDNLNARQVKFKNFSIVILWSFLSWAFDSTGDLRTHVSNPYRGQLDCLDDSSVGMSDQDWVRSFYITRKHVRDLYFHKRLRDVKNAPDAHVLGPDDLIIPRLIGTAFYKDGIRMSQSYTDHLRRIRPFLLDNANSLSPLVDRKQFGDLFSEDYDMHFLLMVK